MDMVFKSKIMIMKKILIQLSVQPLKKFQLSQTSLIINNLKKGIFRKYRELISTSFDIKNYYTLKTNSEWQNLYPYKPQVCK